MADERHHEIVNVSHRGILGGWVNWCSCGASIVESDGGHDATDAHLAGPPQAPRPRKTRHFTDAEMAAHDAEVARAAAERALREAADAFQVGGWAEDLPKGTDRPVLILGMAQSACDWLRDRADRPAAGGEDRG